MTSPAGTGPRPLTDSYRNRLKNYLLWATMDSIGMSGTTKAVCVGQDDAGLSPEEIMFRFETNGENKHKCTDLSRLYRYLAGKNVRDFYVSNWVNDVANGLFVAEEFICTGGMDLEEFRKVFKRDADPWLLRRMWKEEALAAPTGPAAPPADTLQKLADELNVIADGVYVQWPRLIRGIARRLATLASQRGKTDTGKD